MHRSNAFRLLQLLRIRTSSHTWELDTSWKFTMPLKSTQGNLIHLHERIFLGCFNEVMPYDLEMLGSNLPDILEVVCHQSATRDRPYEPHGPVTR